MTIQNYLIIEDNVVINTIVWNGDTATWTPPSNAIVLVQENIPSLIWVFDNNIFDYVLEEQMGNGSIGFTWNGSVLTTNELKPVIKD
jgi:hypothetical protein